MNSGLQALAQAMAGYLKAQGVPAAAAWEPKARPALDGPVAAVSLRGCRVTPAGFQDYLGEACQEESGLWQAWYGREVRLTFGLDLYAPEGTGDGEMQQVLDQLAAALLAGGPEGMAVEEFSWEALSFDREERLLKRPGQAVCRAYLRLARQEGGLFTDFILRGGIKA